MNPEPSPEEIYEAFKTDLEEKNHAFPTVTICDLYFQIKKRHRGYKLETFHKMQEDMYFNWTNWNGYLITLSQGTLTGVCTKYKKDRNTIHPIAFWKFINMKPLENSNYRSCE